MKQCSQVVKLILFRKNQVENRRKGSDVGLIEFGTPLLPAGLRQKFPSVNDPVVPGLRPTSQSTELVCDPLPRCEVAGTGLLLELGL